MAKIAVVYWSGTGNTEMMAEHVAEGCKVNGDEVEVMTVGDTDASSVAAFDKVALGCPAMGDEALEEDEFQPFWDELKTQLASKPVVLFGSFNWAGEDGEGIWMQNWTQDAKDNSVNLVAPGVICYDDPQDEKVEELVSLGKTLANA